MPIDLTASPAGATVPTSYTSATFQAFMDQHIGSIADILGWTVAAGSYNEPEITALLWYGVVEIADATVMTKLGALGRVAVLQQAAIHLSTRYDTTADGASLKRSQMQAAVAAMLSQAESDALVYGSNYALGQDTIDYTQDPYTRTIEDEADEASA